MESALRTQDSVNAGNWVQATQDWSHTEYVIWDVAHNIDFYNILKKIPSSFHKISLSEVRLDEDAILDNLMNGPVKEALGLDVVWGESSGLVFNTLAGDFMKPVIDIGK